MNDPLHFKSNICVTNANYNNQGPAAFLSPQDASRLLGVPKPTLRRWADAGELDFIRKNGPKSKRYYDVQGFLEKQKGVTSISKQDKPIPTDRIVYARVSTRNQLDDLERQKQYLHQRYPEHDIVTDVASGLNFNRPGLRSILDRALQGTLKQIVVAHQDRLCRFGFDLLHYLLTEKCGVELVVLNNQKSTPQEELVTDLLSIVTVFSARANGLRKYKSQIKQDFNLPDLPSKETP
jgi:excisionase family DNA binding protein